jgi:hypothetical protein
MKGDIRLEFVVPFLEVRPQDGPYVASKLFPSPEYPFRRTRCGTKFDNGWGEEGRDSSTTRLRALRRLILIALRAGPFQQIFFRVSTSPLPAF